MSAASAIQVGRGTSGRAPSLKAFLVTLGKAFHTADAGYRRSAERNRGPGYRERSFQMDAQVESEAVVKRLYDAWLV